MSSETDRIKNFVSKFFESLKCEVIFVNNVLSVRNIPEGFEKFCGRIGPYKFVFEKLFLSSDTELLSSGSFLLKAINDYLEGRGQTTLLKIEFEPNFKEEIEKRFTLKNCKITNLTKKIENNFLVRFSFITNFQYLNDKEQAMNSVFVKEGKVVEFDLEKYKVIEGKKRDISFENIQDFYKIAKEELNFLLEPKLKSVSQNLQEVVNKEIERVKQHYENHIKEFTGALEKAKKRLNDLEEKGSEVDKIAKVKQEILNLENNPELEKLKKEEEFCIRDEVQKHSLNVKTKLMNTTIVYYPIYSCQLFFKNDLTGRIVHFDFNPLENKASDFSCDSCNSKLNEIILCSSGHLTCRNCGERCGSCNEIFCKTCLKKICASCGKKICDKCAARCAKCGKFKCKSHMKVMEFSGENICESCLKRCFSCGGLFDSEFLKIDSSTGRDICFKCSSKEVSRKTLDEIFKK